MKVRARTLLSSLQAGPLVVQDETQDSDVVNASTYAFSCLKDNKLPFNLDSYLGLGVAQPVPLN